MEALEGYRSVDIGSLPKVAGDLVEAPEVRWVPISDIVIDDSYQRPLLKSNWTAITRIAKAFTWARFTPVLLAPVAGGRLALIDGQHRTHAALMRGYTSVPAMIVRMTHEEQAEAFAHVNNDTIKITLFHIYKAALAAGSDWAIRSRKACEDAGCRLMPFNKSSFQKQPGEVYTISLIRSLIEDGCDEVVSVGLGALRGSSIGEHPDAYSATFIRPWLTTVGSNQKFLRLDLPAFLDDIDPFQVIEDLDHRRKTSGDKSPRPPQVRAALTAALQGWRSA